MELIKTEILLKLAQLNAEQLQEFKTYLLKKLNDEK